MARASWAKCGSFAENMLLWRQVIEGIAPDFNKCTKLGRPQKAEAAKRVDSTRPMRITIGRWERVRSEVHGNTSDSMLHLKCFVNINPPTKYICKKTPVPLYLSAHNKLFHEDDHLLVNCGSCSLRIWVLKYSLQLIRKLLGILTVTLQVPARS
jgi:hypothetical protein